MHSITLPMAELKPALAGLGKIIGKRSALPVLGYVRIARTQEGHLELSGTDLQHSVTALLPGSDQGEPTAVLVPFADLAEVAKNAGRSDMITLARLEDDQASIRIPVAGTMIERRCESLPVVEFPDAESVGGNEVLLNAVLREAIHQALSCASTDETRRTLNGAWIDVSKKGAHYVIGTDGVHLFSSNSFVLPLAESVILPSHPFLRWKGFNRDGDWRLRVKPAIKENPQVIELASDRWRYTCRGYEGDYPDWRQVVPTGRDFKGAIAIPSESMDKLIKMISRLPDQDPLHHAIGLEVHGDRVQFLAKAGKADGWTPFDVRGAKATGLELAIFFNRVHLLKALRFGLSRIDLIDARSPLRFSDGGRQMIVMPVRVEYSGKSAVPTPPADTRESPGVALGAPATLEASTSSQANDEPTPTTPATVDSEEPLSTELVIRQLDASCRNLLSALAGLEELGGLIQRLQREGQVDRDKTLVRAANEPAARSRPDLAPA
jgi:DNA polymerase III sliding clamp (beta) subunit (PCNA family)